MNERRKYILYTIIKEHIKTGAPVGSSVLVDKYKLDVSSATVRNEMAELEKENYIMQPYTSAGRVPTEKAYNLYLESIAPKKPAEIEMKTLNGLLDNLNESNYKQLAKEISKFSGQAVFWAIERHNFYYTGISNLLQQPEFVHLNNIFAISTIIDKMDEIIEKIFDELSIGVHTLIGSANPFSNFCSTIISKYEVDRRTGMFGILGPLRMNYDKNLSLVTFINEKLNK